MSSEPEGATVRFWIDGQVAMSDRIVRVEDVGDLATTHANLADDCNEYGRKWMVEFVFDDGEHVRWGTDVDGMVIPLEVGMSQLLAVIAARWQ